MYYINLLRENIQVQPWMPIFFTLLAGGFFAGFYIWHKLEPRSLKNGLFINLGLLSIIFAVLTYTQKDSNQIWELLTNIGLTIFVIIILIAVYAGIVLLIWNARILAKPNKLTTANLVTIGIAIAFVAYLIIFGLGSAVPNWLGIISTIIPMFVIYLVFVFADFLVVGIIENFYRPTLDYDFLIVLGAGLVRGNQISSTLGSRLRKAFDVAQDQYKTTHIFPVIIVAGGKGNDETTSEAAAMRKWLIFEGYPKEYIILEDKSRNTLQNMENAKTIIQRSNIENPNNAFITNSYHIVRAGIYARRVKLNARGIGSKTPGFFIPTGWLREFAAIMTIKKQQHIRVFFILLAIVIFGALYYQLGIA